MQKLSARRTGEQAAWAPAVGRRLGQQLNSLVRETNKNLQDFSPISKQFIGSYLSTYVSLSGNASGRKMLVAKIIETAKTREAELDSAGWEPAKIAKALANMLVKKNRDATAQAADVAEAPVA